MPMPTPTARSAPGFCRMIAMPWLTVENAAPTASTENASPEAAYAGPSSSGISAGTTAAARRGAEQRRNQPRPDGRREQGAQAQHQREPGDPPLLDPQGGRVVPGAGQPR